MSETATIGRPAAIIAASVEELRRVLAPFRRSGERIALVPTMGALHEGHLALVRDAAARAERVVVSIFVNPAQFAPNEDFGAYPRQMEADLAQLAPLGVTAVFAPDAAEMYPAGFATTVSLSGPAEGLETDFRPHFFAGVATVVAKLLIAAMPDVAIFGEKDYQQLLVIRRMTRDLGLPVEIVGHPVIREADGLALSSRNAYLSAEERSTAPELHAALQGAAAALRHGSLAGVALAEARARLERAGFVVDYVELRNAETLAVVKDHASEPQRLLAAARLGRTRLIDNIGV